MGEKVRTLEKVQPGDGAVLANPRRRATETMFRESHGRMPARSMIFLIALRNPIQ